MKKFLSHIVIFNLLFVNLSFFTVDIAKASTPIFASDNYFVVTAYYSPLPNQKYYFKGSYDADIKLNGRGLRGASGKEVFAGMFAAPKSYTFGTKIYLEGLGVGEVADRGGAIVSTNPEESRGYEYDRIDIWMGHGEEGLARALAFGKRTIKGHVIADSNTELSINLHSLAAPTSILAKYEVSQSNEIKKTSPQTTLIASSANMIGKLQISPQSSSESDVKKLQNIFKEMGLYTGEIDGKYESIKDIFITYQVYRKIISSKNSPEAGYFGEKTNQQLNKDYIIAVAKNKEKIEQKQKIEAQLASIKKSVDTRVEKHISSIGAPKIGDVGENVRNLQKTLKTLGYFKVSDTAIFGETTQKSLLKYQLDKGIISSHSADGAGIFGPKTKESIKSELAIILETQLLKEKDLLSYKNK